MRQILIGLIHLYRLFSKYFFPLPVCRFEPSCSEYAMDCMRKYGAFKGGVLALWRLIKCNPFIKGGYDPVK